MGVGFKILLDLLDLDESLLFLLYQFLLDDAHFLQNRVPVLVLFLFKVFEKVQQYFVLLFEFLNLFVVDLFVDLNIRVSLNTYLFFLLSPFLLGDSLLVWIFGYEYIVLFFRSASYFFLHFNFLVL